MVVEDSLSYREVVSLAIAEQPDMELTHAYGTAEIALRTLRGLPEHDQPTILLLDLRLPDTCGIDAIPLIHQAAPVTKILVLSQSDAPEDILRAIEAGVSGYLLKTAPLHTIADGIRTVSAGGGSLDATVARLVLDSFQNGRRPKDVILSEREHEVLSLLADGLVKKEISSHLGIGYSTVDTHVSHIYAKLNVSNAPAAISRAYRLGILPVRPGDSPG